MRVFVTGATGFIGAHLVRLVLADGCEVSCLSRPGSNRQALGGEESQVTWVDGALESARDLGPALRDLQPELCLHFAWYAIPNQHLTADENLTCLQGSMDLLRVLDAAGCRRIVTAGTCYEQDLACGYIGEDTPVKPAHLYAASKQALFLMTDQYQRSRGHSSAHARLFPIYGPGDDTQRLIPHVIRCLLRGEPCEMSSGEQLRDFLHVEDAAAALWAIAKSDAEGTFSVGSGTPVSIADTARLIAALLGRPELLRLGARSTRPGEVEFFCADTGRLRRETSWSPRYTLESGLKQTIDWWKSPDGPLPGPQ